MRRRSRLLAIGLLLGALGGVLLVLGALLKNDPDFYAAVPELSLSETTERSGALMTRVQDLKNDIRSKPEWGASFRADDLNCFFRENLSDADGSLAAILPAGLHTPRVAVDGDRVKIGLTYGEGFWRTVVWIEVRAWLVKNDTNVIAMELCGLQAGSLPFGCQTLLDSISEAAHDSNVEVTWYRHDGNPVGLFRFYADQLQPATQIHTFKVTDGRVTLAGRTRLEGSPGLTPVGGVREGE